jgi:two-component system, LytTR family, response regulator
MSTPINTLPYPTISVGSYRCLSPQQIVRLEAARNYTIIHQVGGRKLLVSLTLKTIEERLKPYDFLRVRRGDAINPYFIEKVGEDGTVLLADGTRICPSRRRKSMFRRLDTSPFIQK